MRVPWSRYRLLVIVPALLAIAAYYHQRTLLCDDALHRRRDAVRLYAEGTSNFSRRVLDETNADVGRLCFTWVGG